MAGSFLRRLALLAMAISLLLSASRAVAEQETASADGQTYDLRYKLKAGEILRYDVKHRASIRSTIDESTQSAQTRTHSVKAWKVVDVLPSGQMEFINVVERVRMSNQLPDRAPVEYDSAKDETPPPGFEQAAKAVGVPLSVIRITPQGKIVSRDIKHPQEAADEDAAIVIRLPDEPVKIGATWDEPFEVTVQLRSGGTKAIQTRRHYQLAEVADGIATIDVVYQVLSPVDAHIESQLLQRLMKGTVQFDIATGRVIAQEMEVDKQILGFAGPTSSMHYVMRMEEKLLDPASEVARKP